MNLKKFQLGKTYHFNEIEKFVEENVTSDEDSNPEFTMNEYGQDYTGRGFIVLENDREDVISFISDGYNNGTTYKCIYIG